MNILALDLGTHTGWALLTRGRLEHGVQVFDVKRGESPGMRYVRFRQWLATITAHSGGVPTVGLLVYEQIHNRGGAATEVAAGFATRVQEQAADLGIEHAAVHTGTLKKFTTGSGAAKKPAMVASVQKRWAPGVTDDNEADAIALLHFALAEMVPAGIETESLTPRSDSEGGRRHDEH